MKISGKVVKVKNEDNFIESNNQYIKRKKIPGLMLQVQKGRALVGPSSLLGQLLISQEL